MYTIFSSLKLPGQECGISSFSALNIYCMQRLVFTRGSHNVLLGTCCSHDHGDQGLNPAGFALLI